MQPLKAHLDILLRLRTLALSKGASLVIAAVFFLGAAVSRAASPRLGRPAPSWRRLRRPATVHARILREKLSMTACMYAFVPSSIPSDAGVEQTQTLRSGETQCRRSKRDPRL
jgi:hypothetical protein